MFETIHGRNDPKPSQTLEKSRNRPRNRLNRLTPNFSQNDPGQNDPAKMTYGRSGQTSENSHA